MQAALLSETESLQGVRSHLNTSTTASLSLSFTAVTVTPPQTCAPSSPHSDEGLRPPLTAGQTSLQDAGQAATEAPSVLSGPPQQTKGGQGSAGVPLSGTASGSERYPEAVEALRNVGALRKRFGRLEARVAALEGGKVDQSQLTNLRELIVNQGTWSCLSWLCSSLSSVIGPTCILLIFPSFCLLPSVFIVCVSSVCPLYLSLD